MQPTRIEPLRIFIPEATPSLNVTKKQHWGATKQWRKKWAKMLLPEVMRHGGRGAVAATGKRQVLIERHGKKPLDDDNRYGGCKTLIDELRTFGLLVDDNSSLMALVVVDVPLGKGLKPHTVITLTDISA